MDALKSADSVNEDREEVQEDMEENSLDVYVGSRISLYQWEMEYRDYRSANESEVGLFLGLFLPVQAFYRQSKRGSR